MHRTKTIFTAAIAALVLLTSGLALAQDDDAMLAEASRQLVEAQSYRVEYALNGSLTSDSTDEVVFSVEGTGSVLFGAQPALDLSLNLRSDLGGAVAPTYLGLRVVEDVLYFTTTPGDVGWTGTPLEEMMPLLEGAFMTGAVSGLDGTTTEAVIDPNAIDDPRVQAALGQITTALAAFDINPYVVNTRLDNTQVSDVEVAHFSSTVDIPQLVGSEQVTGLLLGLAEIADPSLSGSIPQDQLSTVGPMLASLFDQTSLTVDRYVSLGDNTLRRLVVDFDLALDAAALGTGGESVNILLNTDIRFDGYNEAITITAPPNAVVMSDLGNTLGLEQTPSVPLMIPTNTPPAAATVAAPVTAQSIVANTPTTVALTPAGPVDLTYNAASAETINVVARSLEAPGTVDTTVEVLDANGIRLNFNDDHTGSRTNLQSFDSAIEALVLPGPGSYTIRVSSFSGAASGNVEVVVESDSAGPVNQPSDVKATPSSQGESTADTITGVVPNNSSFTTTFSGTAGQMATITVRSTDDNLDPKVALIGPNNQIVAENDDHGTNDANLDTFDSRISGVALPADGEYTVEITGFAGTGGAFELVIERGAGGQQTTTQTSGPIVVDGNVTTADDYEYTFDALAGDVIVISVASVGGDLDPQAYLYDSEGTLLAANDDHSSPADDLAGLDSRISNFIIPADGTYTVNVGGYQDSVGPFELTIETIATNAPLTPGETSVVTGSVQPGGVFTETVSLQAGDYITVAVRALTDTMDPQVLLVGPSGNVITGNDDQGLNDPSLGRLDSLITNVPITAAGEYTIEVTGYQNSAGEFAVTITILR